MISDKWRCNRPTDDGAGKGAQTRFTANSRLTDDPEPGFRVRGDADRGREQTGL